jgi:hypothetical protein
MHTRFVMAPVDRFNLTGHSVVEAGAPPLEAFESGLHARRIRTHG